MKKSLLAVLSFVLVTSVFAQPLPSAKNVEVTNYKEVLSQIDYPQVCRENGIEGVVLVSLNIDEQGKLVGHEFISYPCSDLKSAVKESLSKLKFSAAVGESGKAITSRITMPVKFELSI